MEEKISQIKFDKKFIKKLLDKLKVGNTRSIHLNALPGRAATRLDLYQLSQIEENFPQDFIEMLLNNDSFSFPISYDKIDLGKLDEDEKKKLTLLSKRLNTQVIENNDNFLEYGIKNFGFGFPLLIKRGKNDPTKIIKAPLFIWSLDIERSYQNKNTWTIKKEEDAPIKLNELLISHLSKDESIQLEKISKEILEDGILDENELLELCNNILSQLNAKTETLSLKIEKCPDKKTIESIANSKAWIQWSWIFWIYRSQKETIIHATEELLERADEFESENLILDKFQTSTISAIETDPSKEQIINTLTKDEIKLIQGPPGTGKSQSITAIVSNALANNAKCLIVCEKKTALDVIQANLEKAGLSDFSIVLDDVNKDRKKVIEKARNINENENQNYNNFSQYYNNFSQLDFKDKYNRFCNLKKELNAKYREPLKKVFGDFTWKELIGLYLRFSKTSDFHSIIEKLDYEFLEFNHEEYLQYLNIVKDWGYLYEDIEKYSEEVFSILDIKLFSSEYKWATYEKVKADTKKLLETLDIAYKYLEGKNQSDCEVEKVSIFKPESISDSEDIINVIIEKTQQLKDIYNDLIRIIDTKKDSFLEILGTINIFLSKRTQSNFVEKKISIFNNESIDSGLKHFSKSINIIKLLLNLLKQGEYILGDKFYKKSFYSKFTERFSSIFSKRYKNICNIKENIFDEIEKLRSEFMEIQKLDFLDFTIKDFKEFESFLELKDSVSNILISVEVVNQKILKIKEDKTFLENSQNKILELEVDKIFSFLLEDFITLKSHDKIDDFYKNLKNKILNIESKSIVPLNFFKQETLYIQQLKEETSVKQNLASKKILELSEFNFKNWELNHINKYSSFEEFYIQVCGILEKVEKIKSKIWEIKNLQKRIEKIEKDLQELVSNNVFNFEVKNHDSLKTFDKISEFYSNIEEKIKNVQKYFDAYESFHNWKVFEFKCDKNTSNILLKFKNIPAENWKNIFKAWYYRGALLNYEENSQIGFNKSDSKLQQLSDLHIELKGKQLDQIKYIWWNNRDSKLSAFNYNFNALYNLRRNKTFGRRNSLRKLIETDLDLFTTLFPIILTNPGAVNALFPLKQGLFEIVIFDEASQLRVADTFTSLIRGKYKIIAGDKHQMPPSNYFQSSADTLDIEENETDDIFTKDDEQAILAESESLLQYVEDLKNINKSYLDFHYRSEHPALIEFSNSAFYGGNLISFPEQEVYKPIEFRAVNGIFESSTNPSEIEEVLKILQEEIHPNQKGKYPSIGIATFNINQRNLIIETLNEAAELDILFAQKLQELKEKGLFVKNLENIQGDERDIIIISTTYGIKPDGKFTQNFARLNRIEGYKLLNVLITRAKKKLYVCTSIPKEKYFGYSEIIQNEGNNKKGILYAYLAYAEAISNHDNELAESILRILKEQSFEKPRVMSGNNGLSESPFEEEVYDELLDNFEKDNIIQQYKVGGFRLDFVVKTKSKDIVLECDWKAYHQSDEAHAHDMYRQKELENMGFIIYRIWSTNWFQDKEREMQRFLQFVDLYKGNC